MRQGSKNKKKEISLLSSLSFFPSSLKPMMKFGFSKRAIITLGVISVTLSLSFLYYFSTHSYSANNNVDDDGAFMYGSSSNSNNGKGNNNGISLKEQPTCLKNTATKDFIKPTKDQWEQCLEPGSQPSYYLSIVIVTRMDDYAG
jgi:hypothetical protein